MKKLDKSITLLYIVGMMLAWLKYKGVIDWHWVIVTIPFWLIQCAVTLVLLFCLAIVFLLKGVSGIMEFVRER